MANAATLASFGGILAGATATAVYVAPAGSSASIRALTLCNVGANTTVSVQILRAAGAPAQVLLSGFAIAAGASYVVREAINQVLAAGDALQVSAANADVWAVAAGAKF